MATARAADPHRVKLHAAWAASLLAGVALAASGPVPPELRASAAQAKIEAPLVAWCRGEFRAGHLGAFAIAVAAAKAGGRYLVVESNGRVFDLAPFAGRADLACYPAAEAAKLSRAIADSETVHGSIAPAFATTVVCGFVEETSAVCWQYSPTANGFVKVGEWFT